MAKKKTSAKKTPEQETSSLPIEQHRLRDIATRYNEAVERMRQAAEENDGIVPDELLDEFEKQESNLETKGINYAVVFESLDRVINHALAVKKRADAEHKRAVADKLRFEKLAYFGLDRAQVREAGRAPFRIAIEDCPMSVDDAKTRIEDVPDEFCDYKVTLSAFEWSTIVRLVSIMRVALANEESEGHIAIALEEAGVVHDALEDVELLHPSKWEAARVLRKNDAKKAWADSSGQDDAVPGLAMKRERKLVVK
jgi:hypothetical protein